MVAAEQVSPLPAAVAGVVVGGPAAPPDVSHQLPTALLHLLGLRRRQQCLDLLGEIIPMSFHVCSEAIKVDTGVFVAVLWNLQAGPAATFQASSISGNLWPPLLTPS